MKPIGKVYQAPLDVVLDNRNAPQPDVLFIKKERLFILDNSDEVVNGTPDLVVEEKTGWLVPIRSPELLMERLAQCETQRAELAAMVGRSYDDFQPRAWDDVAGEFETICDRVRRDAR